MYPISIATYLSSTMYLSIAMYLLYIAIYLQQFISSTMCLSMALSSAMYISIAIYLIHIAICLCSTMCLSMAMYLLFSSHSKYLEHLQASSRPQGHRPRRW